MKIPSESPKTQRYLVEFGGALGVYVVLLFGSIGAVQALEPTGALRAALVLLPMLGAGALVAAIVRHLRRVDELQRRIALESLAVAFAGTAFATLTWGFLEGIGLPRLSMFCVWPLMAVLWMAGALVAQRRYR
jgi:hypothetical protein